MENTGFMVYPRVYRADSSSRVYVRTDEPCGTPPMIRISGMEIYTIPHARIHRIDDEERYPFLPMTEAEDGSYYIDYAFVGEQRYSLTLKLPSGTVTPRTYLYSLGEELWTLSPFKGDTHLHTCRSDGEGTPLEVAADYRAAGFDFIAITDHHKFAPSVEGRDAIASLTSEFRVYTGEEVHNRDMGYFHIVNFGGESSVNEIIESDPEGIEAEVDEILASRDLSECASPYECAYRMLISQKIREAGGVSVLPHPYWEAYGEYNMQSRDLLYLLRRRAFDALELVAGCDADGNGNNIQLSVWADLRAEGIRIPIVGSSDAHTTNPSTPGGKFNRQFTVVYAPDVDSVKEAVLAEHTVAVIAFTDTEFLVLGTAPLVKYTRFLLREFYPSYRLLTARHAELLRAAAAVGAVTQELREIEGEIADFRRKFFGK